MWEFSLVNLDSKYFAGRGIVEAEIEGQKEGNWQEYQIYVSKEGNKSELKFYESGLKLSENDVIARELEGHKKELLSLVENYL